LKTAMKAFSVQPVWLPKLDICLGNFGKPLIQLFLIGAQLHDTLIPQHAPENARRPWATLASARRPIVWCA